MDPVNWLLHENNSGTIGLVSFQIPTCPVSQANGENMSEARSRNQNSGVAAERVGEC
jgi:hypothetical protein